MHAIARLRSWLGHAIQAGFLLLLLLLMRWTVEVVLEAVETRRETESGRICAMLHHGTD